MSATHDGLPAYRDLPRRAGLPASWGLWGDDGTDVFGCLNLLTPERVVDIAGHDVPFTLEEHPAGGYLRIELPAAIEHAVRFRGRLFTEWVTTTSWRPGVDALQRPLVSQASEPAALCTC
jgi:hypothetical protein